MTDNTTTNNKIFKYFFRNENFYINKLYTDLPIIQYYFNQK
jgi:hypothetical protein